MRWIVRIRATRWLQRTKGPHEVWGQFQLDGLFRSPFIRLPRASGVPRPQILGSMPKPTGRFR